MKELHTLRARVGALEAEVETRMRLKIRDDRITSLESQLAAATQAARNLVARIDGDGGQKQEGETVRESCDRADGVVVGLHARVKELEALLDGERALVATLKSKLRGAEHAVQDAVSTCDDLEKEND